MPGDDRYLVHHTQKGVFPFAPRDFVTIASIKRFKDKSKIQYLSTSIENGESPVDSAKVRAILKIAAWTLIKTTEGVRISYIIQVDVGGNIPASVLRIVQTQTPLCIAEIDKYLRSKGPLPFLVQTDENNLISISEESFDVKTDSYFVKICNKHSSRLVNFALPKKRYSDCKVVIKGLSSNQDVRLIKSDFDQWVSDSSYLIQFQAAQNTEMFIKIDVAARGTGIFINDVLKSSEILGAVKNGAASRLDSIFDRIDSSWDSSVTMVANGITSSKCAVRKYARTVLKIAHLVATV